MEDVERPQSGSGSFAVATEVYSGPLDLLIDLIERRKLLVNDISLATVTDDYLKYVATLEQGHMRETADFVVLASTLLLIKSRSLLPVLELTDAEEENVADLERRLKLYQIFRHAGATIERQFGAQVLWGRRFRESPEPIFITDRFTDMTALSAALYGVIERLPKKVFHPAVRVRPVVSLEEMILKLKDRIEQEFKLRFKDFTGNKAERGTIIVGFLAVLEMVKQGMVTAHQGAHFDEIEIEREAKQVPSYG